MTTAAVTTPALEALVQRMCAEYDVPPDRIRDEVTSIYAEFADARVQTFVPVLVERRLRDRLRAQVGAVPAPRAAMTG
jgi:hypothetical protein